MATYKMIVSSLALCRVLDSSPRGALVKFSTTSVGNSHAGHVNDIGLGYAEQPFDAFSIPPDQADRLRRVVEQLEEQPITLQWNGDRFTIIEHLI